MARRSWQRTVWALVAVVLCVLVATVVPATAAATPTAPQGRTAAKYAPPPIPAFERFFAQQFHVSVMTQSYGVFNATLRMRGSMNFPERVQGELIPLGEPRLNRRTQTRLSHFQRARGVEDEKLSELPFNPPNKQNNGKVTGGEFAAAGEEERPSLLLLDIQLLHSDASQGKVQAYYLPSELMALRSQREALGEGSVVPAAMVDFTFRVEAPHMSNNPLSDTAALARVSAATVATVNQKTTATANDAEAASATTGKGDVIFRWITEHEFSAVFLLPLPAAADKDGAATTAHLERVWVYGYATPTQAMYNRKQREVPWYNKYLMLGVALMGFVVQIISGWTEGKTKAVKAAEREEAEKSREQAKLEAALKQQERLNKKKK